MTMFHAFQNVVKESLLGWLPPL